MYNFTSGKFEGIKIGQEDFGTVGIFLEWSHDLTFSWATVRINENNFIVIIAIFSNKVSDKYSKDQKSSGDSSKDHKGYGNSSKDQKSSDKIPKNCKSSGNSSKDQRGIGNYSQDKKNFEKISKDHKSSVKTSKDHNSSDKTSKDHKSSDKTSKHHKGSENPLLHHESIKNQQPPKKITDPKNVKRKLDINKSSDRRELRKECRKRKLSIILKKLEKDDIRRCQEGRIPPKFRLPKDDKKVEKKKIIDTGEDSFSKHLAGISSNPLSKFKIPKKIPKKENFDLKKELNQMSSFSTKQKTVRFASTDSSDDSKFKIPKNPVPKREAAFSKARTNLSNQPNQRVRFDPRDKTNEKSSYDLKNRKNLGEYMQEKQVMQQSKSISIILYTGCLIVN